MNSIGPWKKAFSQSTVEGTMTCILDAGYHPKFRILMLEQLYNFKVHLLHKEDYEQLAELRVIELTNAIDIPMPEEYLK